MHKTLAGERLLTEIEFARLNKLRGAQRPLAHAQRASMRGPDSHAAVPDQGQWRRQHLADNRC